MTKPRRIETSGPAVSRRTMLAWSSAGVAGVLGGGFLAACSSDPAPGTSAPSGTSGGGSTSKEALDITQLLSTPGPSFANGPMAIAAAAGFYQEEGVNVTLEYPGTSVRGIQTLVGGTGALAAADSFAVLVATAEEIDIRSIFLTARGYVFGFAVNADSPIEEWSLDTVQGSKIGITDFSGGEVPVLRGALARLGVAEGGEDGVELVPIGGGGAETADAIEGGDVDIVAASILDFEIFKTSGVDLRVITPDYIADFPGPGYVTTPALLDDNQEAITRMLRAQAKATVFLKANPTVGAQMAIDAAPASAEGMDPELVSGFLQSLFVDGNAYAFDEDDPDYHRLGAQDPDAYDDFQKFLIETGTEDDDGTTLSAEVDVDAIVDNSLIDDINDFDYAEIEALAEQW